MVAEGYVKFNCEWAKEKPLPLKKLKEINELRNKLFKLGLIGAYPDGVGFGNISIRQGNLMHFIITGTATLLSGIIQPPSRSNLMYFIITGTATGGIANLNEQHYTTVTDFDFERNWLRCSGPIKASSESLTHAAIYQCDKSVNAVIHVHNLALWKKLLRKVPTTKKEAEYGTPEMAKEIIRLFKETDVRGQKILVMAGHREGVISFGRDLKEAGKILLKYFKNNN